MRAIHNRPKQFFIGVIAAVCLGVIGSCKPGPSDAELKRESERRFGAFQMSLQKELGGAIGKGGFQAAVKHCKIASPALEKKAGGKKFVMKRVSDRPRNPAHAPDEFERKVLEQWKGILERGGKIATVGERTPTGYRVMKPIRIAGGLCLKCHGGPEQMDPAAAKEIAKLYPDDKAVGYKVSELRGAFSAVWKD